MVVAVIGAGAWGTTVAAMLAERHETRLWAREAEVAESITAAGENRLFLSGVPLPASLRASGDLDWVCTEADVVIMAVPAQHVRSMAGHLAALVSARVPVVSLAKGIERSEERRVGKECRWRWAAD